MLINYILLLVIFTPVVAVYFYYSSAKEFFEPILLRDVYDLWLFLALIAPLILYLVARFIRYRKIPIVGSQGMPFLAVVFISPDKVMSFITPAASRLLIVTLAAYSLILALISYFLGASYPDIAHVFLFAAMGHMIIAFTGGLVPLPRILALRWVRYRYPELWSFILIITILNVLGGMRGKWYRLENRILCISLLQAIATAIEEPVAKRFSAKAGRISSDLTARFNQIAEAFRRKSLWLVH